MPLTWSVWSVMSKAPRRSPRCAKRRRSPEAGIDALKLAARPGLDEALLYATAMARMLELGTEYFPMTIVSSMADGCKSRAVEPSAAWPPA